MAAAGLQDMKRPSLGMKRWRHNCVITRPTLSYWHHMTAEPWHVFKTPTLHYCGLHYWHCCTTNDPLRPAVWGKGPGRAVVPSRRRGVCSGGGGFDNVPRLQKNKLLPHDDDDFVLLRFAILLLLFLLHRYIHTMWTLLWCGMYLGKPKDDTNTIERRPINVPWEWLGLAG